MRPQPGERLRVVRSQSQDREWHRDEGVQVERTGLGDPDLADRRLVLRPHRVAQLVGQEAGAGDADRTPGWRRRHQQVEPVFRQARVIVDQGTTPAPAAAVRNAVTAAAGPVTVSVCCNQSGCGKQSTSAAAASVTQAGLRDPRCERGFSGRTGGAASGSLSTLQAEQLDRAVIQQLGPAHIAAHGFEVAVPGMAHDRFVAGAGPVGFGDEPGAQAVRR